MGLVVKRSLQLHWLRSLFGDRWPVWGRIAWVGVAGLSWATLAASFLPFVSQLQTPVLVLTVTGIN